MRQVIELTHTLSPDVPVLHPWMAVELEPNREIATHGSAHHRISLGDHTGSHVDAPAHMLAGGADVASLNPANLLGPAQCVDLRDKGPGSVVSVADLRNRCSGLDKARRLVLATGWDARFGGGGFFEKFPCLSLEAAEMLAAGPLTLLAMDTPSPGPLDEEGRQIHRVLMDAGIIIAESLKNLTMLPPNGFEIAILPIPLAKAGGAPCRAVAWMQK